MSDIVKITVAGVCTFVVGQILQRLFIEPIQEFQRARGKVASALSRHFSVGGVFTNEEGETIRGDPEVLQKVGEELRLLAGDIRACAAVIPFYPALAFILRMPSRQEIKDATGALQQWSTAIYADCVDTCRLMEKIDDGLRLDVMWYYDQTGGNRWTKERRRNKKRALVKT